MDGSVLVGVNGATLVDGLTNDVDNAAESLGADGNQNGVAGVHDGLATDETLGGVQSDGTHVVTTEMLSDLEHESVLGTLNFESVENRGELARELHVNDGTNNLRNLSVSNLGAKAT